MNGTTANFIRRGMLIAGLAALTTLGNVCSAQAEAAPAAVQSVVPDSANVTLIRKYYAKQISNQQLFSPEVEWISAPGASPDMFPFAGEYHGYKGLEKVADLTSKLLQEVRVEAQTFVDFGDVVLVQAVIERAAGSPLLDAADWRFWRIRDGKVISVIDCPDLARIAPVLGKLYPSFPVIYKIPSRLIPDHLRSPAGEAEGSSVAVMQKWFADPENHKEGVYPEGIMLTVTPGVPDDVFPTSGTYNGAKANIDYTKQVRQMHKLNNENIMFIDYGQMALVCIHLLGRGSGAAPLDAYSTQMWKVVNGTPVHHYKFPYLPGVLPSLGRLYPKTTIFYPAADLL